MSDKANTDLIPAKRRRRDMSALSMDLLVSRKMNDQVEHGRDVMLRKDSETQKALTLAQEARDRAKENVTSLEAVLDRVDKATNSVKPADSPHHGVPRDGWQKVDRGDGRPYWWHSGTNATSWSDPFFSEPKEEIPTSATKPSAGWQKVEGPPPYWWHTGTNQTSWADPTLSTSDEERPAKLHCAEGGTVGQATSVAKEEAKEVGTVSSTSSQPPQQATGPPGAWEIVRATDGTSYYWNRTTNQTSWEKPAACVAAGKQEFQEYKAVASFNTLKGGFHSGSGFAELAAPSGLGHGGVAAAEDDDDFAAFLLKQSNMSMPPVDLRAERQMSHYMDMSQMNDRGAVGSQGQGPAVDWKAAKARQQEMKRKRQREWLLKD
jgi:hypothetical protein